MSSFIDQAEAISYVKSVVKEAGLIINKYFSKENLEQKQKQGVDFTTQADIEVDKFLQEKLKRAYPTSNFLTEETAPPDLSSLATAENLWVIDPLDGTVNFSRRHTNFAISIALVNKNEPKLGVVYLPLEDKLYFAQQDKESAFLNEKAIRVSTTSELRETVLACDWSWDLNRRKVVVEWMNKAIGKVRQIKCMGSAAADLASLAVGEVDGYLHSGLKPWDMTASALIIMKAGGIISLPNGDRWTPFNSQILATNNTLYKDILNLINS